LEDFFTLSAQPAPQAIRSSKPGSPFLTMPRKRTRDEMEASEPPQEQAAPSLLTQIRNMWEFASTMQYIFLFGKAVKIDEDFDIEVRPTVQCSL